MAVHSPPEKTDMRTRNVVVSPCAVLLLAALSMPSRPATAKQAAPAKDASFAGDVEKLTRTVALTEEQQKSITALKATRDAALAKWDETHQKRIAAIQEQLGKLKGKRDARARSALERQRKVLESGRATVLQTHERGMFAVLTREQRGRWNGPILAEAVLKEYARIKLDDAQKSKVRDLCRTRGEGVAAPVDPKRHEATFKAVKQQTLATVLTAAQRKEYAGSRKPSAPRKGTQRRSTRRGSR
jgi:hypothetical protein